MQNKLLTLANAPAGICLVEQIKAVHSII